MDKLFLSPIVGTIIESLKSAAIGEIKLLWGVEDEVENLMSTLGAIQGVLKDAEEKQWKSHAVKDWLVKLDEVVYDADDVIDEFATEAQQAKLRGEIEAVKKRKQVRNVLCCFSGVQKVKFRHEIGFKIQGIRERLEKIAKERHDLGLVVLVDGASPDPVIERPKIGFLVDESDVIGREDETEKIVKLLRADDSKESNFSVIPILGMGGLGKTTLAQLVYKEVSGHFEAQAWVSLHDAFDEMALLKAIIAFITRESCETLPLEALQGKFLDILAGKKFLLVLDDVWNENPMGWDRLRVLFRVVGKGSKILVTTRSQVVARIMGTVPTHNLEILTEGDSWSLFMKKAFADENIETYSNLVTIGKEIVKKCNGLPLAVKTLGCHLRFNKRKIEWEKILKSEIWDMPGSSESILPALKLSYLYLPIKLKKCFAYCSIFPRGYEFMKDELVKLWMAQKYTEDRKEEKMEDIGGKYFDDLLMRSFFQHGTLKFLYTETDFDYKLVYKMHDLIHDLAKIVTKEECHRVEQEESFSVPIKARHVLFSRSEKVFSTLNEEFYSCKGLHSLFLPYGEIIQNSLPKILHNFRRLRVLSLYKCFIAELPDSIGDLKHLRYLDLSFNVNLSKVPDSVCGLCNLQTLKIDFCMSLNNLPKDMKNLINLRHLHCDVSGLKCMPHGLGKLTHLQFLSKFIVGREEGCKVMEMKELNYLNGGIEISRLNNVRSGEEAKEAHLKNKELLQKLTLRWDEVDSNNPLDGTVDEEVLENLEPHSDLVELCIKGYRGVNTPRWLQVLRNLQSIELDQLKSCQRVPPLGLLPQLKHLKIIALDGLQRLGSEFCGHSDRTGANNVGYPSLESLQLIRLPNLEEWSGLERGDLPSLSELRLTFCPKLKTLPPQLPSSLVKLDVTGCESLVAELQFPSLQKLVLSASNKMLLDSVPHLTSLSSLTCFYYPKISSKLLQPLTSLKELWINACHDAEAVEVGQLPSTLQQLKLDSCYELQSLSGVQFPSSLKSLHINYCQKLVSLPADLKMLSRLESLDLWSCPKITSLPEYGLPSGLQSLRIFNCPMLYDRCQEEIGEDWPKIATIPFRDIRRD